MTSRETVDPVRITDTLSIGEGFPLTVIAGPCQIESLELCLRVAEFLCRETRELPVNLVFKSSFDKANRTSVHGERGLGLEKGLEVLERVRQETGLPVLTDIHTAEQARAVGEVVDVLQIPAFLCRQTDLLVAAGKTGRAINVKKGQFLHPSDMKYAAEKIASTGNNRILLCERGTCFGYRDLVVDFRSLMMMRELRYPVVFDGTHSVQSMGGAGGSSSGPRKFIPALVRAAVAVGIDGLFLECHPDPASAPSDGASMLPLEFVPEILRSACDVRKAVEDHALPALP